MNASTKRSILGYAVVAAMGAPLGGCGSDASDASDATAATRSAIDRGATFDVQERDPGSYDCTADETRVRSFYVTFGSSGPPADGVALDLAGARRDGSAVSFATHPTLASGAASFTLDVPDDLVRLTVSLPPASEGASPTPVAVRLYPDAVPCAGWGCFGKEAVPKPSFCSPTNDYAPTVVGLPLDASTNPSAADALDAANTVIVGNGDGFSEAARDSPPPILDHPAPHSFSVESGYGRTRIPIRVAMVYEEDGRFTVSTYDETFGLQPNGLYGYAEEKSFLSSANGRRLVGASVFVQRSRLAWEDDVFEVRFPSF